MKALNSLPPISSLKLKKNPSPSAEHYHHSDRQINSSKTTSNNSASNGLVLPDSSTSYAAGSRPQQNDESSSETDGSSSCEQILVKNCELGNDIAIHSPTDDLCEMEMFVQGSSDSVCVLLMEKGSLSDVTALKKIVRSVFTLRIVFLFYGSFA